MSQRLTTLTGLIASVAAGCYEPEIPPCSVRCDPLDPLCSAGRCCGGAGTCRADGMCYASESAPACGWEELGPEGGNISSMFRVDFAGVPFLVAGGAGGMMRSSDDGEHWYRGDFGMPEAVVAVSMGADGLMYAGGVTGEVYMSSALGTDWWPMDLEVIAGTGHVRAMASGEVQPGSIAVLYVARDYEVWKLTAHGFPNTWSKCGEFPIANAGNTTRVTAMAVHPTLHHIVVGTDRNQLFRSKDGCASWQVLHEGADAATFTSIVLAESAGPNGENIWFAGQRDGMPAIYAWPDTFERDCPLGCAAVPECPIDQTSCAADAPAPDTLCTGSSTSADSLVPLEADPRRLIIGTVRDGMRAECYGDGELVPTIPAPLSGTGTLDTVTAMVSGGPRVIAGYENDGVERISWDEVAKLWAREPPAALPYRGQRISDLAWVADHLLAATPRGAFARRPDGSWIMISDPAIAQPVALIVPQDALHAFALYRAQDTLAQQIIRFERAGESWVGAPLTPAWPASTAPDAMIASPDTLLVMSCGTLYAHRAGTWTTCGMVHPCIASPPPKTHMVNAGADVYIATPYGVFVAAPAGGPCPTVTPTAQVAATAAVTYDAEQATVYGALDGQVFTISTAPPYTAQAIATPALAPNEYIVTLVAAGAGELVLTTRPRGRAFVTRDRGGSWQPLPSWGMWPTTVLAPDPSDPSAIYAGSDGRGVLRVTLDEGE